MAIDDNANYTLTGAQVKDLANEINGKADSSSLASVATSGDYGDLLNTPTIPTVNDATLTIQKNGTNVQTFTANQSTNATANITVPTSFSDLSGTVGTSQIANTAVTNAKITDSTIAMGKIDWSTMRASFSGTTDGNGFIAVPTGTVRPTTGFILGARRVKASDSGQTDGILLPYTDHSQSRYTLKFINWNMQANGNQTIKVEIIYCLLSPA